MMPRHQSVRIATIVAGAMLASLILVLKKIETDVATANDIVHSTSQNAATTRQIAVNAEHASQVADEARQQAQAARAEVDRGLAQIQTAREEAQTLSTMMGAL
jgi:methyl-accepting chemotaxis protein